MCAFSSDVAEPPRTVVGDIVYSPAGETRLTNRQTLAQKKERLLHRKTVSKREVSRTLDLLNETQPINVLPNEMLVYIIELSQPTPDALDAANWLGRLYICRRWYHLITSVPRFWRDIYVSSHPEWLELCLSRCAGVIPANVYITGRFSLMSTIPALQDHASAIRGITYTILRASWVSDIAQLLSVPLPSLQTIDISLSTKSPRYATIDSRPENLTHLKTLKLRCCRVPTNPAIYATLSSLNISRCSWRIRFENFLDVIKVARTLSVLILDDCFAEWYKVPQGLARRNPPRRTPILLRQVRFLQLTAIPAALASQLLAHIRIPNAHHLHINAHTRHQIASTGVWDILPVNVAAFCPSLTLATSLRINASGSSMSLHMRASSMSPKVPMIELVLFDSLSSSAQWDQVLRSVPAVQQLSANMNDAFFSTLKAVPLHAGATVCCPNLTTLSYSNFGITARESTFDAILDCLRIRSETGTRLDKLALWFSYHSKEDRGSRKYQQFVTELKTLVRDVKLSEY